jgi:drug/metabolite transporter (DMT)-like permease
MTTDSGLSPGPIAGSTASHAGPFAAFGLMALLWGYNWVVMKIAMQFSGPLDFAAWRGGLGVLLLFCVLLALRVPLRPRHVAMTIWLGLFQTTGFVGLISWSLTTGAAGKSAVLAYTMPFWVILFGWPFLAERLRGWQWVAVGLALVGLVLVLEVWDSSASVTSSVLALAAGASWGVSVILFKRIPVNTRDELLSLTAWQMLYGCIPLIAAAWLVPERPIEWSGAFIAALSFNAVGGMAIATLLWLYILYTLPATISSLSSLIVPIVGVLAAWIQLGEQPSLAEGAGMLLILAGLGLLIAPQRIGQPVTGD